MQKWFALITPFLFLACTQKTEAVRRFAAGYTAIHITDSSRIYKPGTDTSDPLHYRPIDLDVWYPADTALVSAPLKVRDLFSLLETRANVYTGSNLGTGLTTQLAKLFCDAFQCSEPEQLLNYSTSSVKGAKPAAGQFPLVIYMTAYNGMSYENYLLFEALAKKGYTVVSISSVGRFPGDMTMKKEDLMEQVGDAVIALRALKGKVSFDPNSIGVVGYSWGGMAGAVFAKKVPSIKCLVSMEGSELHHYSSPANENEDFDGIMGMDLFRGPRLSIPYLRLESAPAPSAPKDSVYPFYPAIIDNADVRRIDSMKHEDFGCLSAVVRTAGNCTSSKHYTTALEMTVKFLDQHTRNN
ncbi:MAG: alpha/beta fold hydrolase [Chitinophagaceae bacterium]